MLWTWLLPIMCFVALGGLFSTFRAAAQPLPPTGVQCGEGLANGGFEQDRDWTLPGTAFPAAYSNARAHRGARSLRAGILTATENVYSYSAANQTIVFPTAVPTDVETATLTLWWWPITTEGELTRAVGAAAGTAATNLAAADLETLQAIVDGAVPSAPLAGDRQYVILTNENNKVITSLLWARSNAQQWQHAAFDLTPYRGRPLRVHIGVYNDGVDGVTAMYADDVAAQSCRSANKSVYLPEIRADATLTATATPTATAMPTVTPTVTPTLEPTPPPTGTVVWTDPREAIEVFSPVAGGLYHSPIEVRGFSQTFEGVVNMRLQTAGGNILAERTAQGGSVDGFAFFASYLRFTAAEEISATLEVFEVSAQDGSEIHTVSIPLTLLPGQRVVDLAAPGTGETVCGSVYVHGYSNTFEANVLVTLSARDGTVLTSTATLGGNLGIYADFSTALAYAVAEPQPVLLGVTEGSAAGFGYIDYTRVPLAWYPLGAGCPLP
jgi:hypothetical protein